MQSELAPSTSSGGRTAVAIIAVAGIAGLVAYSTRGAPPRKRPRPMRRGGRSHDLSRAGQELNRASGMLAASVLFDSAMEHYRGQFRNRAMYLPLVASSLTLAASLHGTQDERAERHPLRHAIQACAALTGLVGTGFHIYNVGNRVGGYAWINFFYGAPVGAPFALVLAGALGTTAEHLRQTRWHGETAARVLAGGTALGLLGTVGEAGLLHFRGNFQNPAMYLPVTLPPLTAGLLALRGLMPQQRFVEAPRWSLYATVAMGLGGVLFHAYGVQRMMGGWRNWRQNMIDGPPVPAPPAFTGLALSGLAALNLLERQRHERA